MHRAFPGDPAALSAAAGSITTVADFRMADIAAGGLGAPLTSTFDHMLLRPIAGVQVFQNIGGLANATILSAHTSGPHSDYALDTGPGNCLIDTAARMCDATLQCDYNGLLAARGKVRVMRADELRAVGRF
eukprot:m.292827 g.292827  ORF g.292827 m.292827 type:complete len:131 (-) comp20011_c1_seq1:1041-1433(-)